MVSRRDTRRAAQLRARQRRGARGDNPGRHCFAAFSLANRKSLLRKALLLFSVRPAGFEPATFGSVAASGRLPRRSANSHFLRPRARELGFAGFRLNRHGPLSPAINSYAKGKRRAPKGATRAKDLCAVGMGVDPVVELDRQPGGGLCHLAVTRRRTLSAHWWLTTWRSHVVFVSLFG